MTDLDPMLREAMARVRGPVNPRPSLTDVRRRARRHNRRRMTLTAGVVACTGVATAALIIRRDSTDSSAVGVADETTAPAGVTPTTIYLPAEGGSTTTMVELPVVSVTAGMVWDALWNARNDPAGATLNIQPADQAAAAVMPTPEQFGCTSAECRGMFTYVVWHEFALMLGYGGDIRSMQAMNPNVDFSVPPTESTSLVTAYSPPVATTIPFGDNETPTTLSIFEGIILIDGGAPAGAMEDAYQRLPGYDRTIVPGTGKQIEQTEVMPIGDNNAMASSIGALLGVDGIDTWDPSYLGSPIQGMVAVIVGPDYWDRVQGAPATSTTNVVVEPTAYPTTTSIG
jgi:hypothetical protein